MSEAHVRTAEDIEREADKRPVARDLRPLARLLPYLLRYKGTLFAAFAALTVAAGATLVVPLAVRRMIDLGFSAESAAFVDQYFLAMLGIALVLAIATAARFYIVGWIGERVVADLRDAVYARVIRMDPAFFEVTRTGEVLSRLTTDTTLIQTIVGAGASVALRNMFLLVGGLIMLVVTSPWLTGLVLLMAPVVIVPMIVIGRLVRRLSRESQDRIADTSAVAGEALNAVQTVQAFTQEDNEIRRYAASVEGSFRMALRRNRIRATMTAVAIALTFGAVVGVLWIGAKDVIEGDMTGGELAQFVLYAVLVAGAVGALSEVWGELQRAAGATERLMELLAAEPAIQRPADPATLPQPAKGQIAFENLTFHYPARPEVSALEGLSFSIEPGETIALVGPSGAGKSTVFQLLLRFYDPQSGRIMLDGVDIRSVAPDDVRDRIGIVPQDTVIFAASALDNIRYGRPDASEDEVRAAARAANAEEFIERLPDGYATFLGERGTRLSGGQRQRIAIARAILRDPPVLLLDEATSALDAENERLVQNALETVMQGRTTIVIAHRLATVQKVGRIVVMDEGRVVATGTHESLVREGGLYARLAELQFGTSEETQQSGPLSAAAG